LLLVIYDGAPGLATGIGDPGQHVVARGASICTQRSSGTPRRKKYVDAKEYELKYLFEDEQRLMRLADLVGPELQNRVEPLLTKVRHRISELKREMSGSEELPSAA
jgi:hypothetical protein